MLHLVLDTDVVVAAIRSRSGASSYLVDGALAGKFSLLLSVPLVLEYEAVLTRPEHLAVSGLALDDVHTLLKALVSVAQPVRSTYRWRPLLHDPADDMVLETAINGSADALVTFNQRHFVAAGQLFECSILVPSEALELLRSQSR